MRLTQFTKSSASQQLVRRCFVSGPYACWLSKVNNAMFSASFQQVKERPYRERKIDPILPRISERRDHKPQASIDNLGVTIPVKPRQEVSDLGRRSSVGKPVKANWETAFASAWLFKAEKPANRRFVS